jgi:hypothetical protein
MAPSVDQTVQGQSGERANTRGIPQIKATHLRRTTMPDSGIFTDRAKTLLKGEPFDRDFYRRTFGEWSAETIAVSGNLDDPYAERAHRLYEAMVRNNAPTPGDAAIKLRVILHSLFVSDAQSLFPTAWAALTSVVSDLEQMQAATDHIAGCPAPSIIGALAEELACSIRDEDEAEDIHLGLHGMTGLHVDMHVERVEERMKLADERTSQIEGLVWLSRAQTTSDALLRSVLLRNNLYEATDNFIGGSDSDAAQEFEARWETMLQSIVRACLNAGAQLPPAVEAYYGVRNCHRGDAIELPEPLRKAAEEKRRLAKARQYIAA